MTSADERKPRGQGGGAIGEAGDLPLPGLGTVRVVDLTKLLDPETEKRRCRVRPHYAVVNDVGGWHSEIDIMSHLGTHVEFPRHQEEAWKDGSRIPASHYVGRGVLLQLDTARPNQPIRREDLDAADGGRVQPGDTVLLDSPYHSEPFVTRPDDRRPDMSEEAAHWFVEKQVKCVGWGDGIAIENEPGGCIACHEILLARDILLLEVLKNLDRLREEVFLIAFPPLLIEGLDACPVRVLAIEGLIHRTGTVALE